MEKYTDEELFEIINKKEEKMNKVYCKWCEHLTSMGCDAHDMMDDWLAPIQANPAIYNSNNDCNKYEEKKKSGK